MKPDTYLLMVDLDKADGPIREALSGIREMYGGVLPGVARVLFVNPKIAHHLFEIYKELRFKESRLSPVQAEMAALVVNGLVGGNP